MPQPDAVIAAVSCCCELLLLIPTGKLFDFVIRKRVRYCTHPLPIAAVTGASVNRCWWISASDALVVNRGW